MFGEFMAGVPKGRDANLRFRHVLLRDAEGDATIQDTLTDMCRRDPLFYFNVFGWLLEPRQKRTLPFITRPYQDTNLQQIYDNLHLKMERGEHLDDIAFEKSREVGATWMCIYFSEWMWRFHADTHIGFVSKNEDSVDNAKDPDSLMSKLDFAVRHVPWWMQVRFDRSLSNHSLINLENNSSIVGYPASREVGRGGRKTFFFMDELHSIDAPKDMAVMASTQHVTDCRLVVSTPNGRRGKSGAYYDFVTGDFDIVKITARWQDDFSKAAGLYRIVDGEVIIIDTEYTYPPEFEFVTEGPFLVDGADRSPWYDRQCRRGAATPQAIAAELDLNFGGAAWTLFSQQIIAKAELSCMDPFIRGTLHVDAEGEFQFVRHPKGLLKLWVELDTDGNPPQNTEYSVGADIAGGTGSNHSSNSSAQVFDRLTGIQVASWADNAMPPHRFARLCIALCKFFSNRMGRPAVLVPETNGPTGGQFIRQCQEDEFSQLYVRVVEGVVDLKKTTRKLGYHNSDGGKDILERMQAGLDSGQCVIRDVAVLQECSHYIYKNGKITHALAQATDDESAKGRAHGDRAIAAACGFLGVKEHPISKEQVETIDPPYGSMAWREQLRKAEELATAEQNADYAW